MGFRLIPTQFKSKLPKTLSWPVGAQAISIGLEDVPHASECGLWFSESPVWRASEFQRTLREGRPYAVLVVEYRPAIRMPCGGSKELAAQGWYDPKWEIRVNPVPRPLRAVVGGLIREEGLPAVARWLRSINRAGWEARHHCVELLFAGLPIFQAATLSLDWK